MSRYPHTELPWRQEGTVICSGQSGEESDRVLALCSMDWGWSLGGEPEANAKFIVHACNLHEEMREALERLKDAAFRRDTTQGDPINLLNARAELREAVEVASGVIAKAKGG
jgi:hypothetical protein